METYPGTRYDERRDWLLPQGIVARDLANHVLFPRPKRDARAAAFDELAGNTTLGVHLSQISPGGSKRGHRHVDEASIYIVTGHGWSELKQSDDKDVQRVEWKAGDLISIPSNAWHQHFNADQDNPSLQLAFKNTRVLRRLFASRDFVYDNDFRFHERYDDQPDYWEKRETAEDGAIVTNVLAELVNEPLKDAPHLGRFVSAQRYRMGGHLMLDTALVEIGRRGHVRAHRHLAEEAVYVLSGEGRTLVWDDDGREVVFQWKAGDLFCPPLNLWHQHLCEGHEPARYLVVSNTFVQLALGMDRTTPDAGIPDRFPDLIEPDYSSRPEGDRA
jgi:quercetin dioxygenase-like cupin family protein